MNIQLDDVDDDILNSLAVEHDNFRVSNRPYLLTARSLLSLLIIIIVIYATRPAHTHTTAYNHIHQHTQNYILRSIKKTQKKTKNELHAENMSILHLSPYYYYDRAA